MDKKSLFWLMLPKLVDLPFKYWVKPNHLPWPDDIFVMASVSQRGVKQISSIFHLGTPADYDRLSLILAPVIGQQKLMCRAETAIGINKEVRTAELGHEL